MFTLLKIYVLSTFYLRYARAVMNVHSWLNLTNMTIDIPEKLTIVKFSAKSMESCYLVIAHILTEIRPDRATYKTSHHK